MQDLAQNKILALNTLFKVAKTGHNNSLENSVFQLNVPDQEFTNSLISSYTQRLRNCAIPTNIRLFGNLNNSLTETKEKEILLLNSLSIQNKD